MKATRFMRKPFPVRGFEVTDTNMDAIARWCGGNVVRENVPRPFVRVPVSRSVNEKQTRAYAGTWVIASVFEETLSFKIYKKDWLDRTFFEMTTWDAAIRLLGELNGWITDDDEDELEEEEPAPVTCACSHPASPAPQQRTDNVRVLPTQSVPKPNAVFRPARTT